MTVLRHWVSGIAAASLALSACTEGGDTARINVVLITLDTTRADALGCYGGTIAPTPALDQLAKEGVLFETAIAPVSVTMPTHTTLLTSLWPFAHGVRDNGIFSLSRRAVTLAELFKEAGYATGAVVAAFVLDSQFGLDQGFDLYDDRVSSRVWLAAGLQDRRADEVTARGLEFVAAHAGGPFFLWLHYFDPHGSYDPPSPYKEQYRTSPYYGEVAFMDAEIGRFLAGLRARGLMESTLIVAVADHGESLGQHGEDTHGYFIYDSTMRVPLLMRGPRLPQGRRVAGVTRLIDVMPTVLEAAGLEIPPGLQGISLFDAACGQSPVPELVSYLETYTPFYNFAWCPLEGVRDGDWKYIQAPSPELYDLRSDPGEERNVVALHHDVTSRLREKLSAMKGRVTETLAETVALSSEAVAQLAALGYTAAPAPTPVFTGRDPKEVIHLVRYRNLGCGMADRGDLDGAIREFRRVLVENPENAQVRGFLGSALAMKGLVEEARQELLAAVERQPWLYTCQYTLGLCYGRLGDRETMRRHFLAALQYHARYIEPARDLAVMYTEDGNEQEAGRYLELCRNILAGRPDEMAKVERLVAQARTRTPSRKGP
ncbi:MAG: sulfatase-like hydrolase/transferase [Planctomycetota bacterium]